MSDQIAVKVAHPSPAELSAFSLGQLPPGDAQEVESHISHCQPCCETLLELSSDDTFVALLKEADQSPVDATVDLDAARNGTLRSDATDVPAALAEHPRYRVLGLIGRGGMGDVYAAEHRLMERKVALKVINRDLVSRPEAVERFHREVRAAARLHHPNIVAAYDAEQAGDTHFLAMEFVGGTELSEIVREQGPLPATVACDYARQVAAGLAHAHELGMVHRDIKPQNLMLDAAGRIKILDFGLASFATEVVADAANSSIDGVDQPTAAHRQLTQHGAMMGTPDYIAPEQAADARSADIRSDIYSLGCTLYYMLTGRPPFAGGSVIEKVRSHNERPADSLCALRDDLPAEIDEVVRQMMAKDPADRYQDPHEVVEALAAFVDSRIETRRNEAIVSPSRRFVMARRWLVATALLPILIAAGVVLYLATDTGKIEISSDDAIPGAKVVLSRDGQEYATFNLEGGTQFETIRAGSYEIRLAGDTNDTDMAVWTKQRNTSDGGLGESFEDQPVVLYRGGEMVIEVRKLTPKESRSESTEFIRSFAADHPTITQDDITVEDGAWKITAYEPRTVQLFEVADPPLKDVRFFYRAKIKTENVEGKAYLEMWVRIPGRGEFFSKGLQTPVSGTNGWAEYEIPFLLSGGQQPDLVRLNLVVDGVGTVWIKDVEVRGPQITKPATPEPTSAVPKLRQQFNELIVAARRATTDEQWDAVVNDHASELSGEDVETEQFGREELAKMRQAERRLVELLAGLPDEVHDQLLKSGYLKWPFKELDEPRQQAIKAALANIIDASAKMGFPPEIKEGLFDMLGTGDVGFAIVNGSDGQSLIWYFSAPSAPMPIMLPILATSDREESPFNKSVFKQLGELEDKPATGLPKSTSDSVK